MNSTGNYKQAVTVESLLKSPGKKATSGKKLTAEEMESMQRRFGG